MVEIHRLLRSKRRTLALIIERDGSLTVRAPIRMGESQVYRFVEAKQDWIKRKQAEVKKNCSVTRQFVEGELFHFMGRAFPLRLVSEPQRALTLGEDGFQLGGSRTGDGRALFVAWYRTQARRVIEERVLYFARLHGFKVGKIRISSAQTRWGSCSRKGVLSFTWRLVMAPIEVIDYVVVHELSHLRYMNHSPEFWSLVEQILPDYKRRRAWLKKNGGALFL